MADTLHPVHLGKLAPITITLLDKRAVQISERPSGPLSNTTRHFHLPTPKPRKVSLLLPPHLRPQRLRLTDFLDLGTPDRWHFMALYAANFRSICVRWSMKRHWRLTMSRMIVGLHRLDWIWVILHLWLAMSRVEVRILGLHWRRSAVGR